MHPHVTEVGHALDPFDPNRILSMTRTQRELLAGEDREATIKRTGAPSDMPSDMPSIYKNGLLMGSTDGGRTFHEVPGGLTEFYGHRATIVWGSNNLVVVAANFNRKNSSRVLRISLDGGPDLGGRDFRGYAGVQSGEEAPTPHAAPHRLLHQSHVGIVAQSLYVSVRLLGERVAEAILRSAQESVSTGH